MFDFSEKFLYKIDGKFFHNSYIHIFYKNMSIKWVLEEFSLQEKDTIVKNILQSTTHVEYNAFSKILICKNKWGWNKVEKILMEHYNAKKKLLPDNLIELSLYNFSLNGDEWQNFII